MSYRLLSYWLVFSAALCLAAPGFAQQDEEEPRASDMQVQLDRLEQQLRKLQGSIEEIKHENRTLGNRLDKFSADVDYRLNELKKTQESAPAPTAAEPAKAEEKTAEDTKEKTKSGAAASASSNKEVIAPPPSEEDSKALKFDRPRDHYNYAFKLLNQLKYADAAKTFRAFVEKYPKDPLTGNAYYWLGETYYVQRDYVKAADSFRAGFEAAPKGAKSADNLLKLSMSLSATGQKDKACVVLDQILVKFSDASTSVTRKTEEEIERLGCK